MSEVWRDSKTLTGTYAVSSEGRVKRLEKDYANNSRGQTVNQERILTKSNGRDYKRFTVRADGKLKSYLAHRLIAEVFVPNPKNYPCINHKDGDKGNNHPLNLEWCTHRQNMRHASEAGLTSCKVAAASEKNGSGFWYPSLEVAKNHSKVSKPCICAAARKNQKTAGGMIWNYTEAQA